MSVDQAERSSLARRLRSAYESAQQNSTRVHFKAEGRGSDAGFEVELYHLLRSNVDRFIQLLEAER